MKCLITIIVWIDSHIVKIAGICLVLFSLLFIYWLFYPYYNPISFHPDHLKTDKLVYKPDDTMSVMLHFDKNNDEAPVYLSRWYENSLVFPIPTQIIKNNKGKNKLKINYSIPAFFESGQYRICELVKYQVNPVRTIEYRNCSNYFQVVAD